MKVSVQQASGPNPALQTDERRAALVFERQSTPAPLAAERYSLLGDGNTEGEGRP